MRRCGAEIVDVVEMLADALRGKRKKKGVVLLGRLRV